MPERISDNWVGVISIDTAPSVTAWELERARVLEPFVPDRQPVTIPIENLNAITASIDEQEQVAGRADPGRKRWSPTRKGRRSLCGDR